MSADVQGEAAARTAYEAYWSTLTDRRPWEELTPGHHDRWANVARAVADPAVARLNDAVALLRDAHSAIADEQLAHGCEDGEHPVLGEITAFLARIRATP